VQKQQITRIYVFSIVISSSKYCYRKRKTLHLYNEYSTYKTVLSFDNCIPLPHNLRLTYLLVILIILVACVCNATLLTFGSLCIRTQLYRGSFVERIVLAVLFGMLFSLNCILVTVIVAVERFFL
jgi:hypothetical protein